MPVFEIRHTVKKEEIDNLGHVNNIVYLKWFMDIAGSHSTSIGWPHKKMIEAGEGWVVRRHELDYLVSIMPGEKLKIRTWISSWKRASSKREYEVVRESDGKVLAQGRTIWVWVNYRTGRISHIPAEIIEKFGSKKK